MYTVNKSQYGVTLVEMLVVIAILSLVLGGIYGLLNSAYQTYNHTRAKLESQQTARIVLDYLVYRLREIDGGRSTSSPENCTDCHSYNLDDDTADSSYMPCVIDVTIPQKAPDIIDLHEDSFALLPGIPSVFQNMTGNYIKFKADLLPLHGFNESFTDSPAGATATIGGNTVTIGGNGAWDWDKDELTFDTDDDDEYDRGEPESLDDMNDNSQYDYFGETWTLKLEESEDGPYYRLIESVDFSSLQPQTAKTNGKIMYDNSIYDAGGYTDIPVAYGITGLWIDKVPRWPAPSAASGKQVIATCANSGAPTGCHGSRESSDPADQDGPNIYGDATNMDETQFIESHAWWNVVGLSVEVTTTDTKGRNQQFTRLREFVNFRNIEINQ